MAWWWSSTQTSIAVCGSSASWNRWLPVPVDFYGRLTLERQEVHQSDMCFAQSSLRVRVERMITPFPKAKCRRTWKTANWDSSASACMCGYHSFYCLVSWTMINSHLSITNRRITALQRGAERKIKIIHSTPTCAQVFCWGISFRNYCTKEQASEPCAHWNTL